MSLTARAIDAAPQTQPNNTELTSRTVLINEHSRTRAFMRRSDVMMPIQGASFEVVSLYRIEPRDKRNVPEHQLGRPGSHSLPIQGKIAAAQFLLDKRPIDFHAKPTCRSESFAHQIENRWVHCACAWHNWQSPQVLAPGSEM
jgi:hypothetical protein